MNTRKPIVVGVDGTVGSRRALEWAAREAVRRGRSVRAVTAWLWEGMPDDPAAGLTAEQSKGFAVASLNGDVESVLDQFGRDLLITAEVIEGPPVDVLTHASRGAELLVLGSHGHGAMRHRVLGSISDRCVRGATCPVVILPVPAKEPVAG